MRTTRSIRIGLALIGCLIPASAVTLAADGRKPPVSPADYAKWETSGAGYLSPDGEWLVHLVNRGDGKNELRVSGLDGVEKRAVAFGSSPAFSDDSPNQIDYQRRILEWFG